MSDLGIVGGWDAACHVRTVSAGAIAFFSTNLDDLVLLMVFFGRSPSLWRQTVVGQYFGFSVLVLVSLPGFFVGQLPVGGWVRLLGFLPIILGIRQLMNSFDNANEESFKIVLPKFLKWINPQIGIVMVGTIVNGGDNISVYMAFFGNLNSLELLEVIGIWMGMVGIWCSVAWLLVMGGRSINGRLRVISLEHWVPWFLMGLGISILLGVL